MTNIAPIDHTARVPYRVPFRFDRHTPPNYRLTNVSHEPIEWLTATIAGPGVIRSRAPITLKPGQTALLTVLGKDLARETKVVFRWFRPNGDEYLWSVSF